MKNVVELIHIFNEAKANIRNSTDYIQYEKIISSKLLKKAESADNTPVIVENVPHGILEALREDFKNAGYTVDLLDNTTIEVSMFFELQGESYAT